MPTGKKSGVPWAKILTIGPVIKGNITELGGAIEARWVSKMENGRCANAKGSEPAGDWRWPDFDSPNNSVDATYVAYGKDDAGEPLWIATSNDNNKETMYTRDPYTAATATWTAVNINISGDKSRAGWCNGKWIVIGAMPSGTQALATSTGDPTFWSSVSLSNLADISTTTCKGLATDGNDNWIFTQDDRVYASTDNGVIWFLLKDFADDRLFHDAGYSAGYWFTMATTGSYEYVSRALGTNSGSWSDSNDLRIGGAVSDRGAMGCAVSTGSSDLATIIVVNSSDIAKSHDSGATFTHFAGILDFGSAVVCEGDGRGTWIVGHDSSNISYSIDDGATWGEAASNISGGDDVDSMVINIFKPV